MQRALGLDGRLILAAPSKPPDTAAADEIVTYEAQAQFIAGSWGRPRCRIVGERMSRPML